MRTDESATFRAATGLFDLSADVAFGGIAETLGLTEEQIRKAAKTAASKAGRWAEREGSKELAKISHLSIRDLREATRFRMKPTKKRGAGIPGVRVWFGLNDIPAKLQDPRQTPSGVATSAAEYPGAFISEKLGGHVFKRRGRTRLKIDKVTYSIATSMEAAVQDVATRAGSVYVDEFFKALDKAGGKESGYTQRTLSAL
jgi:hypothetical protein